MKLSLNWLSDLVDLSGVPIERIVAALVSSGTEVNSARSTLEGLVAARVETLEWVGSTDHPLAHIEVNAGTESYEIISGAPNLAVGQLVPYAGIGTYLPVVDLAIAPRSFGKGKWTSYGMLCSARELGVSSDHEGILILEKGKPGEPLSALIPGDVILDVEITTNRPDCLSHWGIARELSATLERTLTPLSWPIPSAARGTRSVNQELAVSVTDTDGCRRFMAAKVDGVKDGESPGWMQQRLLSVGVRPISALVDITNYVAHELGEPMHVFDADVVKSLSSGPPALVIRSAKAGETLHCLDDATRTLVAEDIVVATDRVPLSLAGVIGGTDSGVREGTTSVIVEAASWNSRRIRRQARRHGLRTDASSLFEKEISDGLPDVAMERALALIVDLCGGTIEEGVWDLWPGKAASLPPISTSSSFIGAVLGYPVSDDTVKSIMERLGGTVDVRDRTLDITSPVLRNDLVIPVDIAEEVGRIVGYEALPATLPGARREAAAPRRFWIDVDARIREACLGAGFTEARTTSFVSPDDLLFGHPATGPVEPLVISNPLTDVGNMLRTSVLQTLSRSLALNIHRQVPHPRLFELGHVYWQGKRDHEPEGTYPDGADARALPLPLEPRCLALMEAFDEQDRDGSAGAITRMLSLFSRLVEDSRSGTPLVITQDHREGFHPGRFATVSYGGDVIGYCGEFDAARVSALDCRARIVAGELRTDAFSTVDPAGGTYRTPPKYPALLEDLAFTAPAELALGPLVAALSKAGGNLLESCELTDIYRDGKLGADVKSCTFSCLFRAPDRTLAGEEISAARASMIAAAETLGARLRQ